jgi:protein-S-isoprenylcysteine O-methyltransferase Ste14
MHRYIVCIGICALIWGVNGKWIIEAIRERVTSEVYIHTGLGIFLSLLTLELTLGRLKLWGELDILWLRIIGFILFIPSAILVFSSIIELKRKGRTVGHDPTFTTTFIHSGMYSLIRQPITLGMAIWSVALILVFQSIPPILLGAPSILCFWMSARKEAEYNMKKFGDRYEAYMKKVPMWNIIGGLRRADRTNSTQ